ncbi:MAG: hypothetical protein RAO94_05695 [Candidatus Stygibacter australis]|nr:hypothetical protein [Candidatus Stygibacter australis]
MKKIILLSILVMGILTLTAQVYKPYVLGAISDMPLDETIDSLKVSLLYNGLDISGEYMPADNESRYVIIVSSPKLLEAISAKGGSRAFAAAWRIGLTDVGNMLQISFMNPLYWGNAYFQDDFNAVWTELSEMNNKLVASMQIFGNNPMLEFGSKDGLKAKKLQKYHYMAMMPYFKDVVDIAEFESYEAAISRLEKNFQRKDDLEQIYRIDIPNNNLTLYGFGFSGEKGESLFLPKIDSGEPKHTAFLPYEFLVIDNKVVMLHGRYRIALSFPDLDMGTFMKIMSTPGNIAEAVESLTE